MTTNAAATGFWTAQQRNNARQGRGLLQALMLAGAGAAPLTASRSGVFVTNGNQTTAFDGGASVASGLTITLQPFVGVVNRPGQGPYLGWLLPSSVNVTCDAAPATNPRNDLIVMRVYDAAQGDTPPASGPCQIEVITGSPAASPTDPLTPDSTGAITNWSGLPVPAQGTGGGVAIPLWRARVSTGGTVTLTDIRRSTGLLGAVRALLPGDSLSDPSYMPGDMRWYNGLDVWDGAAWNPLWRPTAPLGVLGVHRPTSAVTSSGTTEKVACFVTTTLVAGRRYKATWSGDLSASNTNNGNLTINNPALIKLRYKAGSSSTATDGTLFEARDITGLSNGYNVQANMVGDFVAPTSGQYTIAATIAAATSAAGNVTQAYVATGHTPKLIVEDIGI